MIRIHADDRYGVDLRISTISNLIQGITDHALRIQPHIGFAVPLRCFEEILMQVKIRDELVHRELISRKRCVNLLAGLLDRLIGRLAGVLLDDPLRHG